MKAGRGRLAEDTARAVTTDVVKDLLREATALKEAGAEQALELLLFKKTCSRMGTKTHEVPCIREALDHQTGRAITPASIAHPGEAGYLAADLLQLV